MTKVWGRLRCETLAVCVLSQQIWPGAAVPLVSWANILQLREQSNGSTSNHVCMHACACTNAVLCIDVLLCWMLCGHAHCHELEKQQTMQSLWNAKPLVLPKQATLPPRLGPLQPGCNSSISLGNKRLNFGNQSS